MKTTIKGREIEILSRQDIGRIFTQKVNDYLRNGFIFSLSDCSRGNQGEEIKACLTKDGGKTVSVIFLESHYNIYDGDTLILQVRKYENADSGRTLWLNEGQEIYHKTFYKINRYGNSDKSVYTESFVDWKDIENLQKDRFENKDETEIKLSDSVKKIALNLLRKKKGHKSEQLKNIVKVEKRNNKFYALVSEKGYILLNK